MGVAEIMGKSCDTGETFGEGKARGLSFTALDDLPALYVGYGNRTLSSRCNHEYRYIRVYPPNEVKCTVLAK